MFDLPDKMPVEAYGEIARRTKIPLGLLRALATKESHDRSEDPRSIRFESHHWRKRRLNHKAARAFDRKRNARTIEGRWSEFEKMHKICLEDAQIAPQAKWVAVQVHSFTAFQIMGWHGDGACGFAGMENFFKNLSSIDGHIKIVSNFFRNSERICFLADRFNLEPRKHRGKLLKLGDLSEISYHYNGRLYERNKHDSDILDIMKKQGTYHA